jgi:hypothetical protein
VEYERAEKIMLFAWAYSSVRADTKVKTEYVTASLDSGVALKVPRKDDPAHREFLEYLGFSSEVIDAGAAHIHFPGLRDWYTAKLSRGENIPASFNMTEYTDNHIKLRKTQSMKGDFNEYITDNK